MRIYIESTIPSYVVARPARDLLQAARQQLTRDWWDLRRGEHELFISHIVLDEVTGGDPEMAKERVRLITEITLLDLTENARDLTKTIIGSRLLPAQANRDAAHIALATVHRMDMLLTWNCRHIANAAIRARLRKLAESAGFDLPVICTPEEMLENSNEIID